MTNVVAKVSVYLDNLEGALNGIQQALPALEIEFRTESTIKATSLRARETAPRPGRQHSLALSVPLAPSLLHR